MNINTNYLNLEESYLFSTIAKKVNAYTLEHPGQEVIRLGIGDVTLPLVPAVVEAAQRATQEMGRAETFHGYGEEQGYGFLRQAVCGYYARKGVMLSTEEVFISDGAKSDLGNILDIFAVGSTVLIPNPVYPVYVDTNVMMGNRILYVNGTTENNFLPLPNPSVQVDLIYLCSPNNPTGSVYNREQLKCWVDYALEQGAVILFDSAYEAFVRDPHLPTSIYQIQGAEQCAIEFCSFSKTAGFTGMRCGYTVIPRGLAHNGIPLNALWLRRQTTKFNGVPYIIQRSAEAALSPEGLEQIRRNIDYYLFNAGQIAQTLRELGIWFMGGENSPYIWLKCPQSMTSWAFFDHLLTKLALVGTPGTGFGAGGEGFFRLTGFGSRENTLEAMERLRRL
jgi:LL-diaminopimelate aminotransferase